MRSADPLLQPFQLGGLTLKNRIMSTSHAIAYQTFAARTHPYDTALMCQITHPPRATTF